MPYLKLKFIVEKQTFTHSILNYSHGRQIIPDARILADSLPDDVF